MQVELGVCGTPPRKPFFQNFLKMSPPRRSIPGPEAGCGKLPDSVCTESREMPTWATSLLLQSALGEPSETVFYPEPAEVAEPGLHIRNLDTGSVFLADSAKGSPTGSPYANKHVGPEILAKGKASPWQDWWVQKHEKDNELLAAAASWDAEAVMRALEPPTDGSAPASMDARGAGGRSPLHVACAAGATSVIKVLLAARASVDACTDVGLSALHIASQRGEVEAVKQLIDGRSNVLQKTSDGNVALHFAAVNGHGGVISALLRHGGGAQRAQQQLAERNAIGQLPIDASCDVRTVQAFEHHLDATDDSFASRKAFAPEGVLLRNSRVDFVHRILAKSSAASPEPTEPAGSDHTGSGISSGGSAVGSVHTPRRNRTRTPRFAAAEAGPRRNVVRGPFARVRTDSTAEQVGPSSFEVVNMLGRGSFGEVYMVKHRRTAEPFAMKVLQKSKVFGKNLQRYAMSERNILSYARHPYIVSLHYAFQTPSCLVMVLEYCPNGNLQQLINQQRRVQVNLARMYTAEILLALCYLHERKVIFRDLKPDNVVLDEQWHVKLTDFGLSKEGVGDRGARTFCGSVAFLAPEIVARREHNHTVDIYNLGVLTFNMLTGMPPFYDNDKEKLFQNIRRAPLEVPEYVAVDAKAFIEAVMKRNPAQRLGAHSSAEVKEHFYFDSLDFGALLRREVPVPEMTAGTPARSGGTRLPRGTPEPFDRRDAAGSAASPVVADWEFSAFQPQAAAFGSPGSSNNSAAGSPLTRRRAWTFDFRLTSRE